MVHKFTQEETDRVQVLPQNPSLSDFHLLSRFPLHFLLTPLVLPLSPSLLLVVLLSSIMSPMSTHPVDSPTVIDSPSTVSDFLGDTCAGTLLPRIHSNYSVIDWGETESITL